MTRTVTGTPLAATNDDIPVGSLGGTQSAPSVVRRRFSTTRQQHLDAARAALRAHSALAGRRDCPLDIQIVDLLCDVRHLIAATGSDYRRVERHARNQFLWEMPVAEMPAHYQTR